MRQDWIEFEGWSFGSFIVRPECIDWVSQRKEEEGKVYVTIHVNDGSDEGTTMATSEPYEQVKQKIIDAEKMDLSNVRVEHFTREEYETMLTLARCERDACEEDNIPDLIKYMNHIIDKLNKILEDDQ